jgi:hypothetical protein
VCVCVCGVVWCGVLEKGKRERERERESGRDRERGRGITLKYRLTYVTDLPTYLRKHMECSATDTRPKQPKCVV